MSTLGSGKLIVFEGPDGVGKSTLVKAFTEKCNASSIPAVSMSFPGKDTGTLGRAVYELHHDLKTHGLESIDPLSLQLLHVAAHIDSMERRIKPLLMSGQSVVLDRFWWSTWVYGLTNGADGETLQLLIEIEKRCWKNIHPSLAVLVTRDQPFAHQPEHAIWDKLKLNYSTLGHQESKTYTVETFTNEGYTPIEATELLFAKFVKHAEIEDDE
jgi:dTMP kinase